MQDLVTRLGFAAGHLAFVLGVGVVAYLIGRGVLSRARFTSAWEEASLSMAMGLGALAHLLLVLGLFGLFYWWAVLAAVALGLLVLRRNVLQQLARWAPAVRAIRPRMIGAAAIVLGVAAPVSILALYPPSSWDATEYYLAAAKLYAREHALQPTPYLRFEVYPQLSHMLFTLGLLFWDDVAAQLMPLLMLGVLAAALVAFGMRLGSRRAGWWASAILVGSPLVLWLGANAYADMGVTLFVSLAAYATWSWLVSDDECWLHAAAALCGFAASAKYTAAPFIALAGAAVLSVSIARRCMRPALRFGVVALAVGAPWYLWNAYHTGNPFYPMLADVFGYGNLNAADLRRMMRDVESRGIGRDLSALVSLPRRLLFERHQFAAEAPLSPLVVLGIPLIVLHAWRDARARVMIALIAAYTLLWFYSAQILRHLIPVIPIASFATATALDEVVRKLPRLGRWTGCFVTSTAIALALQAPGWTWALREAQARGSLPVTQQQRDEFLTQAKPSYPAYALLNQEYGDDYVVYALMDEDMPYFAAGRFMGDWFGPARFARVTSKMTDGKTLHGELRQMKAGFFLVNTRRFEEPLPEDAFWISHFEPIYARDGIRLFRVSNTPLHRELGPNLVQNSGFDVADNGRPSVWESSGTPGLVSDDGVGNAARCTGEYNVFTQRIAVRRGGVYALAFRARTIQSDAPRQARLQVNFSDGEGRLVYAHVEVVDVHGEWMRYEGLVIAPRDAETGTIYASPHGQNDVLFDDFTFAEVSYSSEL